MFLGYLIDSTLERELTKGSSHIFKLFTSGGNYLEELILDGKRFLGKKITPYSSLQEVETLALNVKSLSLKIAPNFPFEDPQLFLL